MLNQAQNFASYLTSLQTIVKDFDFFQNFAKSDHSVYNTDPTLGCTLSAVSHSLLQIETLWTDDWFSSREWLQPFTLKSAPRSRGRTRFRDWSFLIFCVVNSVRFTFNFVWGDNLWIFFKNGPFPATFLSFQCRLNQLMGKKKCWWLDSNRHLCCQKRLLYQLSHNHCQSLKYIA